MADASRGSDFVVHGAESGADQVLTDPARDPSTWSATAPASALAELTSKLHVCVQRVRAAETIDLHAQVLQHCLLLGLGLRALFACSGFVADAELDSSLLNRAKTVSMACGYVLQVGLLLESAESQTTRPDDVRLSNQDRTRTSSSVTCSKAQYGTNILIRAVIIPHVASGAIPSGVPITALPSCFSFFCAWGIFSVEESACCVSTFQLLTVVATYLAQFPLFLKACVRYACGFSCFGWICWSCRGADRACAPELVLPGLSFTKSKVFHNFLL